MEVNIIGKHLDIGESLRAHVERNLQERVKKYFENAIKGQVTISKIHHLFHIDIIVNEGTGRGVVIKSSYEDQDAYHSADGAISKIERQLQRYKAKLRNRHGASSLKNEGLKEIQATKYVFAPPTAEEIEKISDKNPPLIIAEKPYKLERMDVSDAVMRMDFLNLSTLMFINLSNNKVSVVYYRKDGNISWVETQAVA